MPNLRTAILSATVLTVALVLGEFTMASLDQYETFPARIVLFDQHQRLHRRGSASACSPCS